MTRLDPGTCYYLGVSTGLLLAFWVWAAWERYKQYRETKMLLKISAMLIRKRKEGKLDIQNH